MISHRRSANFTNREIETILDYLEENPELTTGNLGGKYKSLEEQKEAWEQITCSVNAVGNSGDIRSGSDVKRKWQDIKCRVKNKVIQIASQKNSTESGSRKPIQLTPLEKRVHAISQRTSLPIPSIESITGARARKKIVIEKNAAFKELGTDCKSMDSEDQSQFLDCASDSTFEKHNMSRASLIDEPETTKQNFSSKEKVSSPDMHHVHKRKFVAAEDNSEESESLSIDDIKELKQEIRKLREAVESVVNIEKMNLQLKCHKYGITVVQLSDK